MFIHVGGATKDECRTAGERLKMLIVERLRNTRFKKVRAILKGKGKYILIAIMEEHFTIDWNCLVKTQGMTPVKRDTDPLAKYVTNKVLAMLNTLDEHYVERNVTMFLGKTITAVNMREIPTILQMLGTKLNCQPLYKHNKSDGSFISVLAGVTDDSNKWVAKRINTAISNILNAAGLGTVLLLMFSYKMV